MIQNILLRKEIIHNTALYLKKKLISLYSCMLHCCNLIPCQWHPVISEINFYNVFIFYFFYKDVFFW